MAQLTTSYQRIAQGTAKAFGQTTSRVDIYAKYNSQSIANNTTNYSVQLRLVKVSGGYIGEYTGTTVKLSSTGLTSYNASGGTGDFTSKTLCTITGDVVHSGDGTKSISASGSMQFKAWGQTISASGSATLPTIPRYANITSFNVSALNETTLRVNWTADAACNGIWYAVNNGSWVATSGNTFDISGLSAGTPYNVKIKVRRTDSGLETPSDNKSATTYPYPSCTSATSFTIGGSTNLTFKNPLNREVNIQMWSYKSGTFVTDLITLTPTTDIPYSITTDASRLYASIPKDKISEFSIDVWYGNNKSIKQNAGTYSINESECLPEFTTNDFSYEDINDNTITMTASNQILVDNYSICKFNLLDRATAKNGATITEYVCSWGEKTISYIEQDMSTYWKKILPSTFTINYDSQTLMNAINCTGVSGWESLNFPLKTTAGQKYKLKFDYINTTGYTPLAGYDGIPCQILTRIDNSDNVSNQIASVLLDPTANPDTQHMELEFTATASTLYINFNFGLQADGTTSQISLGNFELDIIGGSGNTVKMIAIDSRGLQSTDVSGTIAITNIPYKNLFINTISTQRKDGVDSKTFLSGKFNIFNGSWDGTATENSQNRLKYVGYSVYLNNDWSTYYDITSDVLNVATVTTEGNNKIYEFDYNDEVEIHKNGSSGGFDVGTQFQIKVLIKDGNNSYIFVPTDYVATATAIIDDGTVATCLHKDTNGKYHLGINCLSDDDYMIVANDNPIVDNNGNLIGGGGTDIPQQPNPPSNPQTNDLWIDTDEVVATVNQIYPVGSIYMSVNNTNPSTLFGGTWEQIQDRFLLSAGSTYTAGATGGEATHTLTVDEMPSHNHQRDIENKIIAPSGTGAYSPANVNTGNITTSYPQYTVTRNTGGGQAHNNMPPYLVVYMWKRTA